MADCFYDCAIRLWAEKSWKKIVFSGGLASRLEVLREIIQERFNTDCRLTPFAEDTLFGLLLLASVFSGKAESVEELSKQVRSTYLGRQSKLNPL
jgi:sugar (pentulose or hexulose) kinase